MDIAAQISITLNPTDAETLLKKAVMDYLQTRYSISAMAKDVTIRFKATTVYDSMDRGPGSPEFSGVEVTINQATPSRPTGPYADR